MPLSVLFLVYIIVESTKNTNTTKSRIKNADKDVTMNYYIFARINIESS